METKIPDLTPKEVFEVTDFPEKAGMISIYKCPKCEKIYLYTYIDSGITPLKLRCLQCGETAWVEEGIEQPDCIWYRPEGINELKRLAISAYNYGMQNDIYKDLDPQETINGILRNYVIHYNNGKLFAKKLNPTI